MPGVSCLLFVCCVLLSVVCWLLLFAVKLFGICCALFGVCCMSGVCSLRFVVVGVRCLLFVIVCC